jgi:uncharacterized membrane protein
MKNKKSYMSLWIFIVSLVNVIAQQNNFPYCNYRMIFNYSSFGYFNLIVSVLIIIILVLIITFLISLINKQKLHNKK